MSELNYVPSWLDSAMTLLEKLNKCIEKIETIVNTVVSVTKTANDALSLAKTNEANIALNDADITELQNNKANATDITALQADITELQGKTTTLETDVGAAKKQARDAYSLANLANTTANTAQAIANGKSPKLYLHEIFLNTGSYNFKFWAITEESKKYFDKIRNGETFSTILRPFNCVLSKAGNVSISKSLTLQLTDISLNPQNCNGSITFAAYLGDNNQIVTITDSPEWYSASIESESVIEL